MSNRELYYEIMSHKYPNEPTRAFARRIGVTAMSLTNWKKGKIPSLDKLRTIAIRLKLPAKEINRWFDMAQGLPHLAATYCNSTHLAAPCRNLRTNDEPTEDTQESAELGIYHLMEPGGRLAITEEMIDSLPDTFLLARLWHFRGRFASVDLFRRAIGLSVDEFVAAFRNQRFTVGCERWVEIETILDIESLQDRYWIATGRRIVHPQPGSGHGGNYGCAC